MSELSDKVKGWTMGVIGAGGVLSAGGLIIDDPKRMIGYTGAVASLGCLSYGIRYLREAYSNRTDD